MIMYQTLKFLEKTTWSRDPVDSPLAGTGIGVECNAGWVSGKGRDLGVLTQTGPRDVKHHFSSGEGARAGGGGGVVPARYGWTHLYA